MLAVEALSVEVLTSGAELESEDVLSVWVAVDVSVVVGPWLFDFMKERVWVVNMLEAVVPAGDCALGKLAKEIAAHAPSIKSKGIRITRAITRAFSILAIFLDVEPHPIIFFTFVVAYCNLN